jgi:hypothetical protein
MLEVVKSSLPKLKVFQEKSAYSDVYNICSAHVHKKSAIPISVAGPEGNCTRVLRQLYSTWSKTVRQEAILYDPGKSFLSEIAGTGELR